MNILKYSISSMPEMITIGRQTEGGVMEVWIDCTAWRAYWPNLAINAWVTAPCGNYSYPAATRMAGNTLVWSVSASDTAVEGYGTVEIVGLADGQKKLSAISRTRVLHTTTPTNSIPPAPGKAWTDTVLLAASRAENAAKKAEETALVKSINGKTGEVSLSASDVEALAAGDTAVNASKLGGKAPEYYKPAYNLLDNSDFRNPVNQRGATSYTTSGYTIDRWRIYSAMTVNITSDGIVCDASSVAGNFQQNIASLPNGTYTLAAMVNGVIRTRIVTIDGDTVTTVDNSNASFGGSGYIMLGKGTSQFYVQITNVSGYTNTIKWAALYEGSYTADTLPEYVPKGYAHELAECQRYYQKGTQAVTVGTQCGTTTRGLIRLRFQGMRIAPTITLKSISGQGWGNIAVSNLIDGWGDFFGPDYYKNYNIESDETFIGQTIGVDYEASADL